MADVSCDKRRVEQSTAVYEGVWRRLGRTARSGGRREKLQKCGYGAASLLTDVSTSKVYNTPKPVGDQIDKAEAVRSAAGPGCLSALITVMRT